MKYLTAFTLLYLFAGSVVFLGSKNLEFIIYVTVIVAIFAATLLLHKRVQFPLWMLCLLSMWGLMHVAGGAVVVGDHVLFAHRLYPFLDLGGEFYILKYDQVVHGYLYGLVAVMAYHTVHRFFSIQPGGLMLAAVAILISVGISGLNEIMEFIISITMENGVGGYENTMLDMCFNLTGAIVGVWLYRSRTK